MRLTVRQSDIRIFDEPDEINHHSVKNPSNEVHRIQELIAKIEHKNHNKYLNKFAFRFYTVNLPYCNVELCNSKICLINLYNTITMGCPGLGAFALNFDEVSS